MIIFGWRTIVRIIGSVFKQVCDHCHNEDHWLLSKSTQWFTLFFFPAIPLSSKYFLACPVCKYGFALSAEQVKTVRPIAEINQQFVSGKISEAQHTLLINQLNNVELHNKQPSSQVTTVEAIIHEKHELIYCGNCGDKIRNDSKFCGNCGKSTD